MPIEIPVLKFRVPGMERLSREEVQALLDEWQKSPRMRSLESTYLRGGRIALFLLFIVAIGSFVGQKMGVNPKLLFMVAFPALPLFVIFFVSWILLHHYRVRRCVTQFIQERLKSEE